MVQVFHKREGNIKKQFLGQKRRTTPQNQAQTYFQILSGMIFPVLSQFSLLNSFPGFAFLHLSPSVCLLQLQPVQSCFYSPSDLFRLMRCKQTCLRWIKKITRDQQDLSFKDQDILHSSHKNPSATLRSVMQELRSFSILFCDFLIPSSQTIVSVSTMLFTRAVFKGVFHTTNLQQNMLQSNKTRKNTCKGQTDMVIKCIHFPYNSFFLKDVDRCVHPTQLYPALKFQTIKSE